MFVLRLVVLRRKGLGEDFCEEIVSGDKGVQGGDILFIPQVSSGGMHPAIPLEGDSADDTFADDKSVSILHFIAFFTLEMVVIQFNVRLRP